MVDVPDELTLDAIGARVLGCLIEKQATTPDAYPITLNALTTACNQSTSRDPVMSLSPSEVEAAVIELKALGLARVVHPGAGERATKYRHVIDEGLGLEPAERALVGLLLLRGAQSSAELRTRAERLHRFADVADVDRALGALASGRADGRELVRCVGRRPGQRDDRWIQLLEEGAEERAEAQLAAPDSAHSGGTASTAGRLAEIEARLGALEERVDRLVVALGDLVDPIDPIDPIDHE